jgi:hypothetical protein
MTAFRHNPMFSQDTIDQLVYRDPNKPDEELQICLEGASKHKSPVLSRHLRTNRR